MSRYYKKYQEEITREKLIKITCDRCDSEMPRETGYDTRDFELSFTTGYSTREGGYREGWEVADLCDSCVEWLKNLLIENGIKISKVEIDW